MVGRETGHSFQSFATLVDGLEITSKEEIQSFDLRSIVVSQTLYSCRLTECTTIAEVLDRTIWEISAPLLHTLVRQLKRQQQFTL